jgi:DNA invertase Pin-like site-specific DNA recombinase
MKRVAIYARVRTHNGQNPEMQLGEVREFCRRRGWEIAGEDEGISGSKEHRPSLDRLLSECRKRQVDAVVVYRYDRFARSLRQLVNALEEFRALGINFVSLHEGVDTSIDGNEWARKIILKTSPAKMQKLQRHCTQRRHGLCASRQDCFAHGPMGISRD